MTLKQRIRRIQRYLGVTADGFVGAQTVGALEKKFKLGSIGMPYLGGSIDKRSAKNIKTLQPNVQDVFRSFIVRAKEIAEGYGCEYYIISGNRTWAEQDALYAKGRTAPGYRVTNARGGYSNHNFGVAVDCGVFKGGVYLDGGKNPQRELAMQVHRAVAQEASNMGLKWGGDWKRFKDYPHFEFDTGMSLSSMRAKVKAGKAVV